MNLGAQILSEAIYTVVGLTSKGSNKINLLIRDERDVDISLWQATGLR